MPCRLRAFPRGESRPCPGSPALRTRAPRARGRGRPFREPEAPPASPRGLSRRLAVLQRSREYAEPLQHFIRVSVDPDRIETSFDRAGRLQPVAGDDEHDAVVRTEVALVDRAAKGAEGNSGGGLAEDACVLGEESHVRAYLLLSDGVDRPSGPAGG